MEIALAEFAERGYSDATLKDIAVKARLTTGAVYHYFSSKSELFLAVAEDGIEELRTTLDEQTVGAKTFVERLKAAFEAIAILNARHPEMAPFLENLDIDARRYPELQEISCRLTEQRDAYYQQMVLDAVESGEISRGTDPQAVIDLIETFRLGMARFASHSRSVARHRALIGALEQLLDGDLVIRPQLAATGRKSPRRRS